jgi:2-polyprenyl-3-methyl-5-hydroxy-6-metoxy-1,4-benzoquinol methylase
MQEIPCPLCGRFWRRAVLAENGYRGVRCPRCELIFISPRPSWEEIHRLYGREEGSAGAAAAWHSPGKRLKARHTCRLFRPFLTGDRILELGPGAGFFLETMRNMGFQVYGIELNGRSADYLQQVRHIPCESRPLSAASFGGKTFDLIYHCNVLSHLYDPVAECSRMRAKLRDGGLLVCETGNLGEVHPRYYRKYRSFRYPEHLFFFGEKSLRLLLARTGWQILRLYRYPLGPSLWLEGKWEELRARLQRQDKGLRTEGGTPPPGLQGTMRSTVRILVECLTEYVLPYRLGPRCHTPAPGEPQTLIVVARKAPETAAGSHP